MKSRRIVIAIGLVLQLIVETRAQDAGSLRIRILEGEGGINSIKPRVAHNPAVEVLDENGRPVPGADMLFSLPSAGAGASIHGKQKFRGATDSEGRIAITGMVPNGIEGRFNIRVEASKDGKHGSTIIAQSNTTAGGRVENVAKSGSHKLLIGVLAAIGGGAAIGAVSLRGGNSSQGPAPTGTSVSIGGLTVGGPK